MTHPARRYLPAIVLFVGLVGLSVWANDVRGLFIAAAIGIITAINATRGEARTSIPVRLRQESSSWEEGVTTVVVAILLVAGIVGGTILGWASTGNVVGTIAGGLIGLVAGLLAGGVLAGLVTLVSVLVARVRRGSSASTETG